MAVKIELKRSAIPGKVPTVSQLDLGELAINTYDGTVYLKQDTTVTQSIIQLATTAGSGSSVLSASHADYADNAGNALTANFATTAGSATSASYSLSGSFAQTSSYAIFASTASSVLTSSFSFTSSYAISSSYSVSSSYSLSGSYAITASYALNVPETASYAISASHALIADTASSADNFTVRNDITASNALITGTVTAQTLIVQYITSSTEYITGSTIFGSKLTDTHQFTGSVTITGSLSVNGDPVITSASYTTFSSSIAGRATNLEATASTLTNASASFAQDSGSNSIRLTNLENTASVLVQASASFSSSIASLSSSFTAFSQSYSTGSFTGSFNGYLFGTASWAVSASHAPSALTSSYAVSASHADNADNAISSSYSLSGSYAITASVTTQTQFTGSFTGSFSGSINNLQGIASFVPYFSSSQVLITSSIWQAPDRPYVAINQTNVDSIAPEALYVWQASTSSYNVISGKGNLNNYLQLNIQNLNAGTSASSDVVATANNGSETSLYIDMGINNQNYVSNGNSVGEANDAYLYSTGNNLHIGNASTGSYHLGFFVGGLNSETNKKLQLNGNNLHSLTGSLNATQGFTGSLFGTASQAVSSSYALTASFALNVPVTSSFAISASYALSSSQAASASYVLNAISASYAATASTAVSSSNSVSSSFAITASYALNATSASYAISSSNAVSSSYALSSSNAVSASYALSSSNAISASYASQALSSSYAVTASHAPTALTSSYALSSSYAVSASNAESASYAISSSNAVSASYALSSSNAVSGSYAISSSHADNADNAISSSYSLSGSFAISSSYAVSSSNSVSASYSVTSSNAVSSSYAITASNALLLNGTASSVFATTGSNIFSGSQVFSGSLRLDPISDPGNVNSTSTFLFVSGSNTALEDDLYFRQNGNLTKWKWIEGQLQTGLLYGGALNYSGSTVYVNSGSGIIMTYGASYGSEVNPIAQYVNWGPITASAQYLTSSNQTYAYIDSFGSLQQQTSFFAPDQYQNAIPLGVFYHADKIAIRGTGGDVATVYNTTNQSFDFIRAFGPLKLEGLTVAPISSSLSLNVGAGIGYVLGGFYQQDQNSVSHRTINALPTCSFSRWYRSGSSGGFIADTNGGSFYTTINNQQWDNGTGTLATVGNGNWTIQRMFINPTATRAAVYYGQKLYTSLADAQTNIASDPFTESTLTAHNNIFAGYLIVQGNASNTDLANTTVNTIIQSGLFRNTVGGSGGTTFATTLESLSDVNITSPANGQALIYNGGLWVNGNPTTATTASYVLNAISSSYALTASYLLDGVTASFAVSSSYAVSSSNAISSSYAISSSVAVSSSYALSSSYAISSSYAVSSSNSISSSYSLSSSFAQTASYVLNGVSSSYAVSSSYSTTSSYAISSSNAESASYAISASHAPSSLTASYAVSSSNAVSSSYAISSSNSVSSSFAQTASYVENANTASYVVSSSYSVTSSYSLEALSASFAAFAISSSFATTASFALNGGGGGVSAIYIADEGTLQGTASYFDFVGVGVTATVNAGTASINITGGGGGSTLQFTQSVAATTWSFTHNLNTLTPIVQVYNSTYNQIIPQFISASSPSTVEIGFPSALTGYAVVSTGGTLAVTGSMALLNQTTPAVTWSFAHNLNYEYVNFEIYDTANFVIIPAGIQVLDPNNAEIYFAAPTAGKAVANFSGINGAPNATSASYATTSSYASTASYALSVSTASVAVSASYALTASAATVFSIGGAQTSYYSVASSFVGSNNLFTQATGSFTSGFYNYTAYSASNARSGQVMAVWNGGNATYTDIATTDIGSTTALTMSVAVITSQAQFNAQTNTSGWVIKSTVTYM